MIASINIDHTHGTVCLKSLVDLPIPPGKSRTFKVEVSMSVALTVLRDGTPAARHVGTRNRVFGQGVLRVLDPPRLDELC